ncbi:MAG TPA: 2-oxo acid dehydrogenase subunit E2 [Allosphingosinicella sp.]|jgi:2-oxoglutarate dehydrogenase E2 component (dihydrolipoamide succinyltransferase)
MIDVVVPLEQEGTKAVVRAWLKQVGDRVELNDPLVELETDKVAVEVPAPAAGVLREILLETGADAEPGAILGRLAAVAVVSGSEPTQDPAHVERSRDTLSSEAENPESESLGSARSGLSTSLETNGVGKGHMNPELRLSPAVKRACLQHNIDPTTVPGTGRDGRVTRADIDRAVEEARRTPPAPPRPAPASDSTLHSHSVPHDRMRLKIAENMLNSVTLAPHVTAMFEADFSAIIAHREHHKAAWAKKGVKLTYSAYIVAAAAEAMKTAPAINSRWHADRLEIFDDINIGVGTALGEKGLIVPVLRNVETLNLKGIAAGLEDLIARARAEKLSGRDVSGGTFTISNHGVSGSLFATPIIIAQPQSAILGVGKLEKRVVVREVAGQDAILIRPMAYVSLTIDHRVVDGHQTNLWLTRFVEVLETWPGE